MIVRYTRQAVADLDEARAYVALDRPQAADAMVSASNGFQVFALRAAVSPSSLDAPSEAPV